MEPTTFLLWGHTLGKGEREKERGGERERERDKRQETERENKSIDKGFHIKTRSKSWMHKSIRLHCSR